MKAGTEIYKELLNKYPELQKDFGDLKMIYGHFLPGIQLHTTEKAIIIPADMKGMKLLATGEDLTKALSLLGSDPIETSPTDYYMELDKGLAEGIFQHIPAVDSFQLSSLLHYHTILGYSGVGMVFLYEFMNMERWNSLPPDLQQIILEEGEVLDQQTMAMDEELMAQLLEQWEAKGDIIHIASQSEMQLWSDLFAPASENWIKSAEAAGYSNARAIYNDAKKMISEYE
jgi:TRAP-type C4-dicarboxylate transport system substrate-binding protein